MNAYEERVAALEAKGLTTSDAQSVADVEFAKRETKKAHNVSEVAKRLEEFGFGSSWEATDPSGRGWTADLPNGRRLFLSDDTFDGFGYYLSIESDTLVSGDQSEKFLSMNGVKTLGSILAEGAAIPNATPILSEAGYDPSRFAEAYREVADETYDFASKTEQDAEAKVRRDEMLRKAAERGTEKR